MYMYIYIYIHVRERERDRYISQFRQTIPPRIPQNQQFWSQTSALWFTHKKSVAPAVAPGLSSDSSDSASGAPQLHQQTEENRLIRLVDTTVFAAAKARCGDVQNALWRPGVWNSIEIKRSQWSSSFGCFPFSFLILWFFWWAEGGKDYRHGWPEILLHLSPSKHVTPQQVRHSRNVALAGFLVAFPYRKFQRVWKLASSHAMLPSCHVSVTCTPLALKMMSPDCTWDITWILQGSF